MESSLFDRIRTNHIPTLIAVPYKNDSNKLSELTLFDRLVFYVNIKADFMNVRCIVCLFR